MATKWKYGTDQDRTAQIVDLNQLKHVIYRINSDLESVLD